MSGRAVQLFIGLIFVAVVNGPSSTLFGTRRGHISESSTGCQNPLVPAPMVSCPPIILQLLNLLFLIAKVVAVNILVDIGLGAVAIQLIEGTSKEPHLLVHLPS